MEINEMAKVEDLSFVILEKVMLNEKVDNRDSAIEFTKKAIELTLAKEDVPTLIKKAYEEVLNKLLVLSNEDYEEIKKIVSEE